MTTFSQHLQNSLEYYTQPLQKYLLKGSLHRLYLNLITSLYYYDMSCILSSQMMHPEWLAEGKGAHDITFEGFAW